MRLTLHDKSVALWWMLLTYYCFGSLSSSYAQGGDSPFLTEAPVYNYFRHRQDYTYLSDTAMHKNWADQLKSLANESLSIGGDLRWALESFKNEGWNEQVGDVYSLQRMMVFGDFRLKRFRLFTELEHSSQSGRPTGPRFIDGDQLALFQAFIDLWLVKNEQLNLYLRTGRQKK